LYFVQICLYIAIKQSMGMYVFFSFNGGVFDTKRDVTLLIYIWFENFIRHPGLRPLRRKVYTFAP
jgi:hypothetical protein